MTICSLQNAFKGKFPDFCTEQSLQDRPRMPKSVTLFVMLSIFQLFFSKSSARTCKTRNKTTKGIFEIFRQAPNLQLSFQSNFH